MSWSTELATGHTAYVMRNPAKLDLPPPTNKCLILKKQSELVLPAQFYTPNALPATCQLSCTAHLGQSVSVVCELRRSFRLLLTTQSQSTHQYVVHVHMVDRSPRHRTATKSYTRPTTQQPHCTSCMHYSTIRHRTTSHQRLRGRTS